MEVISLKQNFYSQFAYESNNEKKASGNTNKQLLERKLLNDRNISR